MLVAISTLLRYPDVSLPSSLLYVTGVTSCVGLFWSQTATRQKHMISIAQVGRRRPLKLKRFSDIVLVRFLAAGKHSYTA